MKQQAGFFFCGNSRQPGIIIPGSLEVQKSMENETMNGVHARFEPGTLKQLEMLSFFPTRPFFSSVQNEQN